MSETKLYYLGTGTEFIRAQCKEYKTLKGALDAAAKDESLVAWDEDGNVIGSLTDDVPDGSVNAFDVDGNKVGTVDGETVAAVTGNTAEGAGATGDGDSSRASDDNSQNASQDGTQQGDNGQNDAGGTNTQGNDENGQNGANTEPQDNDDDVGASGDDDKEQEASQQDDKEEVGQFHVEVICEGSLRLRRSASFTIDNECGRASKGQTYIGKRIFMSDGLPMVETIDGLFLSAAAEHVKIKRA